MAGFFGPIDMDRGFSLIEILIAMALATMTMAAVVIFIGGDQSLGTDALVNIEALHKAQDLVEQVAATARITYSSVAASSVTDCSDGVCYSKSVTIPTSYSTQCQSAVVGTVSWTGTQNRALSVSATTTITNIPEMLALGGNCLITPPLSGWTGPQRFASDTYSPGKPTGIAILKRLAYLGTDASPFFYIVDTKGASLGQTGGLFSVFVNGFNAQNQINALTAAHYSLMNKDYVFAAMDTATNQLRVINVTSNTEPFGAATTSLSSCVAGSNPEGWAIYYYDKKLYFVTRRTAGPEFHIFDVSAPESPAEYAIGGVTCKGFELNSTVESLVIKDQVVGGVKKRYAYMATDLESKELRVLDVTNPLNPVELIAANQDLPGSQDGSSLYSVGNKLYLGRLSASGPDLYVFNISDPSTGLITLGSKDIGTSVTGITVAGKFAFLATTKANQEFQVWNVANESFITNIASYRFGNIVVNGVVYEYDRIYATGLSTPNFQIIHSP